MTYPYGVKGIPVVGGGLPGLPRRQINKKGEGGSSIGLSVGDIISTGNLDNLSLDVLPYRVLSKTKYPHMLGSLAIDTSEYYDLDLCNEAEWSPNGRILYSSRSSSLFGVYPCNKDGIPYKNPLFTAGSTEFISKRALTLKYRFSRDSKLFFTKTTIRDLTKEGAPIIYSLKDNPPILNSQSDQNLCFLAFSPTSNRIILYGNGGGTEEQRTRSARLYVCSVDEEGLQVIDPTGVPAVINSPLGTYGALSVDWSPDGAFFVVNSYANGPRISSFFVFRFDENNPLDLLYEEEFTGHGGNASNAIIACPYANKFIASPKMSSTVTGGMSDPTLYEIIDGQVTKTPLNQPSLFYPGYAVWVDGDYIFQGPGTSASDRGYSYKLEGDSINMVRTVWASTLQNFPYSYLRQIIAIHPNHYLALVKGSTSSGGTMYGAIANLINVYGDDVFIPGMNNIFSKDFVKVR